MTCTLTIMTSGQGDSGYVRARCDNFPFDRNLFDSGYKLWQKKVVRKTKPKAPH